MPTPAYIQQLRRGAFAGRIDPFAEDARYFQQLHSGMIGALLNQMGDALLTAGYIGSKEVSLQIVSQREPDISIERISSFTPAILDMDYAAAATAILAEPGLEVDLYSDEPELDAIKIYNDQRELVTVIEIISPCNKTHLSDMLHYREQRQQLFLAQNVTVVEIDITRSVKRLLQHPITMSYPYHVAIFIPGQRVRVIVQELDKPIKRCALPLRHKVIPMELQSAYDEAYRAALIAPQIAQAGEYQAQFLPFPTVIEETQRETILTAVKTWQNELEHLK
jgi:hypothetical protein